MCPASADRFFTTEPPGKPKVSSIKKEKNVSYPKGDASIEDLI